MAATLDLEQLARIFVRRGERVVLLLPSGEAVVLVPLAEYEQLAPSTKPMAAPTNSPVRRSSSRPASPRPAESSAPLEAIDPPQGSVQDDDAYFPEPLE